MVNVNTKLVESEYKELDTQKPSSLIYLIDDKLKLTLMLQDFEEMNGNVSIQEFITNKLNSLLNRVSNNVLTKREVEVLENAALGKSNKQIAHILGIKESTVKGEFYKVMSKIHANDRTHAVILALLNGWIDIKNIYERLNEATTEETIDEIELKDKIVKVLNKKL